MNKCRFWSPHTLDEALTLLDRLDGQAVLLSGGTDVVVDINLGKFRPSNIVYLGNIPGIAGVRGAGSYISIGAMTTHDSAASSRLLDGGLHLLSTASSKVGCPSVRNAGTIGGNIVRASPAADTAVALLALDADARLLSSRGERLVPLRRFFMGPGQTIMRNDEILVEVRVANNIRDYRGCFLKQGRRKAVSLAIVNLAVCGRLENNTVNDVRIAMGSVGPMPLRIGEAEAILEGREVSPDAIKRAAEVAAEKIKPISDGRASAWYRREVSRVLLERALRQAFLISKTGMA